MGDLRVAGAATCAQAVVAELKMHVIEVSDYQMDPGERRDWLIRGINALVTQWDDPVAVWTPGIDNYRIQYQAGYSTIPNDLREACAEWVAALFWVANGDMVLTVCQPRPHL
jgi:hypothetical protein